MGKINSYIYWVVAGAIVIALFFFLTKNNKPGNINNPLASITPNISSEPTPALTSTMKPSKTVKPSPGLIMEEVNNYKQLVTELDKLGRHLAISSDCSYIVPSNVAYHNNTQIMLDNTASTKQHILKIGGREYLLEAGQWFLTTLSSPSLPASLPIYCGSMELGDIDLIK